MKGQNWTSVVKGALLSVTLGIFCSLLYAQDLTGTFGSIDRRYERDEIPEIELVQGWAGTAWRGERLNAQIVLWSESGAKKVRFAASSLVRKDGKVLPTSCIKPYFVKYVVSDDGSHKCGKTDFSIPPLLVGDILDTAQKVNIPARFVQPLWITVDLPLEAEPGLYRGGIAVSGESAGSLNFEITIDVLSQELPAPSEWAFHLDLWQNPWAVARYHKARPWSKKHIRILKPLLEMLADAGEKVITTSIIHWPWGKQTFDAYESMVEWTRKKDGAWEFDFSVFDIYVGLCDEVGISRQISCYSMVTWGDNYRYFDEKESDYVTVHLLPGTDEYDSFWEPFLVAFVEHLKTKGWLGRTAIAMDERSLEQMEGVIKIIRKVAPGLKISLAGKFHASIEPHLYDFSYNWKSVDADTHNICSGRREKGKITTYYTACGMAYPNNFTYSPPVEQAWIGWFAAARGFDGFLRWAYCSWVEDPLKDTRHVKFPAGDCFQVYPGPRSSIRFERLREGIQDYEKIRILREHLSQEQLQRLNSVMKKFQFLQENTAQIVNEAKKLLEELSKAVVSNKDEGHESKNSVPQICYN